MAERLDVNDHGIECLKKAAIVPDANYPTRYSLRAHATSALTGQFDAITTSYPDELTEIYYLRIGGLDGAITKTITVVYTDLSKNKLSTMVTV